MATITQEKLDIFKTLFPHDQKIQHLTLDQVLQNLGSGKTLDGDPISFIHPIEGSEHLGTATTAGVVLPTALTITDCQKNIGWVIFDVMCLLIGAVGLRSSVNSATAEAVAEAAAPVLNQIESVIEMLAKSDTSITDLAKGVFTIGQIIYSGGCLGAVWNAFTQSLTWWTMVLYGITGLATIVAAFATDGVALVAEVVIFLATFGWLVTDSVNAVQTCGLSPSSGQMPGPNPAQGANPYPFTTVVALRTWNGHLVSVVDNGGLGSASVAIQTDRKAIGPWEKFTLEPIDERKRTFALRTCNGDYVTAVNGGGVGGLNNANCPIHTDATRIGPWEMLTLVQQTDGTYALCTSTGYYLTTVSGGGIQQDNTPISTNRTVLGPWETFYIENITQ